MRIRPKRFLGASLLFSVMVGTLGPASARATVVGPPNTFSENFTAVVTGKAAPSDTFPQYVALSDPVGGYFSYFTAPTITGSNGLYNFTNTVGPSIFFSVTNPGTTNSFTDYSVSKGAFSITVTRSGTNGAKLDIHALTNAGAAADVILTSIDYYENYKLALPTMSTIGTFMKVPASLIWDPAGQSIVMEINSFNGQSVPEPSSLVLALVAMTTGSVGFFFCRRKGKAV